MPHAKMSQTKVSLDEFMAVSTLTQEHEDEEEEEKQPVAPPPSPVVSLPPSISYDNTILVSIGHDVPKVRVISLTGFAGDVQRELLVDVNVDNRAVIELADRHATFQNIAAEVAELGLVRITATADYAPYTPTKYEDALAKPQIDLVRKELTKFIETTVDYEWRQSAKYHTSNVEECHERDRHALVRKWLAAKSEQHIDIKGRHLDALYHEAKPFLSACSDGDNGHSHPPHRYSVFAQHTHSDCNKLCFDVHHDDPQIDAALISYAREGVCGAHGAVQYSVGLMFLNGSDLVVPLAVNFKKHIKSLYRLRSILEGAQFDTRLKLYEDVVEGHYLKSVRVLQTFDRLPGDWKEMAKFSTAEYQQTKKKKMLPSSAPVLDIGNIFSLLHDDDDDEKEVSKQDVDVESVPEYLVATFGDHSVTVSPAILDFLMTNNNKNKKKNQYGRHNNKKKQYVHHKNHRKNTRRQF